MTMGVCVLRERERERERERGFSICTSVRRMVVKITIQGHRIVRSNCLHLKIDLDHTRIVCNARSK